MNYVHGGWYNWKPGSPQISEDLSFFSFFCTSKDINSEKPLYFFSVFEDVESSSYVLLFTPMARVVSSPTIGDSSWCRVGLGLQGPVSRRTVPTREDHLVLHTPSPGHRRGYREGREVLRILVRRGLNLYFRSLVQGYP